MYNKTFEFNINEIALIEEGLRSLLKKHAFQQNKDTTNQDLNKLLGKIHNNKIFYSQVHRKEDVPLG